MKLSDGNGLYLLVNGAGKYWKLAYRHLDKQKTLSIGVYPDKTLKVARKLKDEAKELLDKGVDPSEHKKASKFQRREAAANSFEALAREWHTKQTPTWSEGHAKRVIIRLEKDIFPYIGNTPISEITPPRLLNVLNHKELIPDLLRQRDEILKALNNLSLDVALSYTSSDNGSQIEQDKEE